VSDADAVEPSARPTIGTPDRSGAIQREAIRVVLFSLALAVVLEVLQIGLAAATGAGYRPSEIARDTVLKIPWSIVVCVGLWIAITLTPRRPRTIALVGLIAAPIASLLARSSAEIAHAYAAAAEPAANPSPFLIAGLRGAEYACLGLVVIWLGRRARSAPPHYVIAGLVLGLAFGAPLLILAARFVAQPMTSATVAAWLVNELLFPAGCALILFVAART
jgi:hypothetical protein